MDQSTAFEVSAMIAAGARHVTVAQLAGEFLALGYRIDRTADCHCRARTMTGPRAGTSFACCTTGLREADTGRSAWHFEARRDAAFKRMQALRLEVFATLRNGAILTV